MARVIPALLLLFVFSTHLVGQSCGKRDTLIVNTLSTGTYTIDIEDYVNDDLSDSEQGLCGIELSFLHQYIDQVTFSISSPAGQSVTLIGPTTDEQFAFTFGARWGISFVPCIETAMPDSGYTAIFDNEQPNNFASFGFYDGSYYPYQGCLEDFNTGPVNGTWTLTIDNTDSEFYAGAVVYLRLIFCDSRGVDCCFSNAGDLDEEDFTICQGDSSLLLSPEPNFSLPESDTVEYGYTYLIAQDSVFLALDSLSDLRGYAPGTYQVCGLSYRRSEIDNFWTAADLVDLDSINQNLNSFFPQLCADISPECQTIVIVPPPAPTLVTDTICAGDSVQIGSLFFDSSGLYDVTLTGEANCDSLVQLDLTVVEPVEITLNETICEGEIFMVGLSNYDSTGTYSDTLSTVDLGCDSIVNLNLLVLSPLFTDINEVICAGDSFSVGDSTFTESGNYQVLLSSGQGCDSTVTLNLTVLNPIAAVALFDQIDCINEGISLDASPSTPSMGLDYEWFDLLGTSLATGATYAVDQAGNYQLVVSESLDGTVCRDSIVVMVEDIRQNPTADAGADDILDCNNPSLMLGGPSTSTGNDFIYLWTSSDGGVPLSPNAIETEVNNPGTYQLLVTDNRNGCQDSSLVVISQDTISPVATISGNEELTCIQLQDTLVANVLNATNYSLNWTGPCILSTSGDTAIVDCLGNYNLEVINNDNGCSQDFAIVVTQNVDLPIINLAAFDTLDCATNLVNLDISGSTPTNDFSVIWTGPGLSPSSTTNSIEVSQAGNYQVKLSRLDNGCMDSLSIEVFQDTIAPIADAGPDTLINCYVPSIELSSPNTSLGAAFSYRWEDALSTIAGAEGPNLMVTDAGPYTLVVTNELNSCRDTAMVVVTSDFATPQLPNLNPSPLLCASDTVQINASSYIPGLQDSIYWEGPCIIGPMDSLIIQANCPGDYWLYVQNLESGCIDSSLAEVVLQPDAAVAALPDTVLQNCDTGLATISTDGTGPGIYNWLYNGNSILLPVPDPIVDEAGNYQLIVRNITGTCRDTASTWVVPDCIISSSILTTDTLRCDSPTVLLDGSGSSIGPTVEYSWEGPEAGCVVNGGDTPIAEVVCEGSYRLIVSNPVVGLADTSFISVGIDTLRPTAIAGPADTITCNQPSVMLDGTASGNSPDYAFFWVEDSSGDTLANSPTLEVFIPGNYLLIVYNLTNGCSDVSQTQVFRNDTPPDISFGPSIIPCMEETMILEAFISPASNYDIQWTGPGIVGPTDDTSIVVNIAGMYQISVVDLNNGCTALDSVEVIQQACVPCLELLSADTLSCIVTQVNIETQFCEPCAGCTLQWEDESGPIPGANSHELTVTEPGIYTLVSVDTLGFISELPVEIIAEREDPMVLAGPDRVLNCDSMSVQLGDITSSQGPDFSAQWTLLDGSPIDNNGNLLLETAEVGSYILTIENTITGCLASDTVAVSLDTLHPIAEAGLSVELTCALPFQSLDASGSSAGFDFSYEWQGPETGCISGETTLNPIVSCPGLYTLFVRDDRNGCISSDTVSVTIEEGLPPVVVFPDTVLTCALPAITLVGNLPNDDDFEPLWCEVNNLDEPLPTTCIFDEELFIERPGRFRYLITNLATGCTNSFIVTVTMDTMPPAVEAGDVATLFCTQDSLILTGQAEDNLLYQWTERDGAFIQNDQSLSPTIFSPGWYYLDVTDPFNGCSVRDSVQILQDAATPSAEAGPDQLLTCSQTTSNLLGSGVTNSGMIDYQWEGPTGAFLSATNIAEPTTQAEGWYYLTVTDPINGCIAVDSVEVLGNFAQPIAQIESPFGNTINCLIDTLLFDASPSIPLPDGDLSYEWSVRTVGNLFPDTTAVQIQSDSPGGYRLVVTSAVNGCKDTLDFSVIDDFEVAPLEEIPNQSINCFNEELTINVNPNLDGIYEWFDANNSVIEVGPTVIINQTGTYRLVFTSNQNGCSTETSFEVDADQQPPTVSIEPPFALDCSTSTVTLDASNSSQGAAFEYNWQILDMGTIVGGQSTDQLEVSAVGIYQLTIFNNVNGCRDSSSVMVDAEGLPITGIELVIQNPGCAEELFGSVTVANVFGGTPGFQYSLNGMSFGSSSSFSNLSPGNYQLEIRDNLGCSWVEDFAIVEAAPLLVDLGPDLELELGDSLEVEALISSNSFDTIIWQPSFLFQDDNQLSQTISPREDYFIIATVIDQNGCSASDTLQLLINKDDDLFIPTGFSPNNDGANDRFSIFVGPSVVRLPLLRIFDRWGNMVFEEEDFPANNPGAGWDGNFEGQPVNAAVFVYYLEVEYVDGRTEVITGDLLLMR